MKKMAVVAAFVAASSASAGAHRLDEYLQAARVAVSPSSIVVVLDLTPGVAIADGIVDRLDADRDGLVSSIEAGAYGRAVHADLHLRVDGDAARLTLIRVEAPTPGEMRDGMGTIRVEFSAAAAASPGRHHLELRNGHLPDRSVYLANALVPESDDVQIVRQERDVRQQEYRLDYAITGSSAGPGRWLLFGAIVMIVHAGVRLKGSGSTGSA